MIADSTPSHCAVFPAIIAAMFMTGTAGASANGAAADGTVFVNQVGYVAGHQKLAIAQGSCGNDFDLVDADNNVIHRGTLSQSERWPPAELAVCVADFSHFDQSGSYFLRAGAADDNAAKSPPIRIESQPYSDLHVAALRAFYLTRSGMELDPQYAGPYARPAGHPDTTVLVHESAAGPEREAGDAISAPGGWYDAGDYNKYVVNSGISTYTLLAAYERDPQFYRGLQLGIPESANQTPDILDEAAWNLRWMLSMADPADGGVYHKLTTRDFSPMVMPNDPAAQAPRYVVAKSTAAALNLAAVAAMASRIFKPFEADYPGLWQRARDASVSAYEWAKEQPGALYQQPADVKTGTYAKAGDNLNDEFAWAGVELFLLTGNHDYLRAITTDGPLGGVPSWDWVQPLAWLTISRHVNAFPETLHARMQGAILEVADALVEEARNSAFRVPVNAFPKAEVLGGQEKSFVWGSNGHVANQAIMLIAAFDRTGEKTYKDAALSALDYLLGRNPLGMSFVSGFGTRPPQHLHHRLSVADGVEDPIPGMLAGGPNRHRQDVENCTREGIEYPSTLPALSYLDHVCSYASNEMAINWNAALVYVTGALSGLR